MSGTKRILIVRSHKECIILQKMLEKEYGVIMIGARSYGRSHRVKPDEIKVIEVPHEQDPKDFKVHVKAKKNLKKIQDKTQHKFRSQAHSRKFKH